VRIRSRIPFLLLVALALIVAGWAQNKTGPDGNPIPLDAADEPHHSIVLENEDVRVLSFELGPQKTTSLFQHASDVVEITLTDADLQVAQGAAAYGNSPPQTRTGTPSLRGIARFRYGRQPQVARNSETVTYYRGVEVEVKNSSRQNYNCNAYDANCVADYSAVPLALERDKSFSQTLDRDTVRITDVQVLPKQEWKSHLGQLPYLVVAVSDLDLVNGSGADDALAFKAPSGGVQWAPKSFLGSVKNMDDKPARFVVVELK
jgi:hypothetical protein